MALARVRTHRRPAEEPHVGAGPLQAIGKTVGLRPTGQDQITGPHQNKKNLFDSSPDQPKRNDRHATHGTRKIDIPPRLGARRGKTSCSLQWRTASIVGFSQPRRGSWLKETQSLVSQPRRGVSQPRRGSWLKEKQRNKTLQRKRKQKQNPAERRGATFATKSPIDKRKILRQAQFSEY